jgi:hypothetical protein
VRLDHIPCTSSVRARTCRVEEVQAQSFGERDGVAGRDNGSGFRSGDELGDAGFDVVTSGRPGAMASRPASGKLS